LWRNTSLAIVLASNKFFALCATTANTDPNLRKELESSDLQLSVLGINLSLFRNMPKYVDLGFPESLNCPEEITS